MNKSEIPKQLKPYVQHGIDLSIQGTEAQGVCPFCNRERFTVNVETGLARCWNCPYLSQKTKKGGINHHIFVQLFWEHCDKHTKDYSSLAINRGLQVETLMEWCVVKSTTTGQWMVPGYNSQGKICQLYRYVKTQDKHRLLATPSLSHGLFGVNLYAKKKGSVYVCEGPWDAMALWETLRGFTEVKDPSTSTSAGPQYKHTANRSHNLLSSINVLAVPGCEVFRDTWCSLFAGKDVTFFFDNDYPKEGQQGLSIIMRCLARNAEVLDSYRPGPKSINYLCWSRNPEQKYHTRQLPNHYDVRDHLLF